jgi:adenylate cyclase
LEGAVTRVRIRWLLKELARRHVYRVTGAYAAGAWVLYQFSSIFVDSLGLPHHTTLFVLIAAIAGLPVTIVLTWIYDVTPLGLQQTSMARKDSGLTPGHETGAAIHRAVASVAVLPFEKLTPLSQFGYVADSLALELQSLLSRVHDLRVVSRQSAVARAEQRSDLKAIASSLAVQYVISGSVAEIGDRLRIDVQLDDAVEDTLLWSERYDVAGDDLDRVQREISEQVVGTFGGERLRSEIRRANDGATADTSASQLVQKARSYVLEYTPDSLNTAIPLLRRAIKLDPKYAVAYATLGLVTAEKTLNGISADVAADRRYALEVTNRAERLAPRDPVVLRAAGCVHAYTGSYRHSIELLRNAVKLAPYDLGTWGYLGWPLVATGQREDLDEVHEIVDRLLATSPQHPGRVYWLFHKSVAYTCADECERALTSAEEYTRDQPQFALGWLHYANVLGRLDRGNAARDALDRSMQGNPLLTPAYYAELMDVLTDQAAVVDKRTSGLRRAGMLEARATAPLHAL